jgi:hypothetical protein
MQQVFDNISLSLFLDIPLKGISQQDGSDKLQSSIPQSDAPRTTPACSLT